MTLQWSLESIHDLIALRAHIAEHDPAAAKRVALHILYCVEYLLSENPKLGAPGRVPGLLYMLVYLPMNVLSGSNTPLESMPPWLATTMQASPSTHFVSFAQSILYRGGKCHGYACRHHRSLVKAISCRLWMVAWSRSAARSTTCSPCSSPISGQIRFWH